MPVNTEKMTKKTEQQRCRGTLPEFLFPLFWDYDPKTIDISRHAQIIMDRIMERGSWAAMTWLRKTYDNSHLISYLEKRGQRILPPRELNYWALICGITPEKRRLWIERAKDKNDIWRARHACGDIEQGTAAGYTRTVKGID